LCRAGFFCAPKAKKCGLRKLFYRRLSLQSLFSPGQERTATKYGGSPRMVRRVMAWSLVAIISAIVGCRMCCHPYDYCGPVWDRGCQSCCPHVRAGSVLAGGDCSETMSQGPQHAPESGKLISTNERIVEPSDTAQMQTGPRPSADSAAPVLSEGWNVRGQTQ
jgi:hypothetical protein